VTLRALAASAAVLPLALFTAPAQAVLPSGNIVPNGDAEAGPGATTDSETQPVPSWQALPNFTAVVYGTGAFPSTAESARIGGGRNFFAGGPDNGSGDTSGAIQEIDISSAAPEIDAGNVQATMTADIGGFDSQEDSAEATAIFTTSGGGTFNGSISLPAASAAERSNATTFVRRSGCTPVTPGARVLYVTLLMRRTAGFYNDGYIDNVDLRLSNAPCPPAGEPPLPPPVETPQPRVNANAEPTRGRVLVKQPGSDTFVELSDARSIPIGSEVDATKGAVQLETAANSSGGKQTGEFYDGSFTLTQTAGARPITELRTTGRIDKCAGTRKEGEVRAAARSRRLWGNARGRFRTRGRHASASVRGTRWEVRDTCTTTTVRVRQGTVIVRDFAKRKNVRLKAPKRYTARARRR
jgi:hypothetical protein